MFGFSLAKLLVLVIVVLAVWYGFKWLTRVNQLNRQREEERARLDARNNAEDLARCAVCDGFVPAGTARHCGRESCPYPR